MGSLFLSVLFPKPLKGDRAHPSAPGEASQENKSAREFQADTDGLANPVCGEGHVDELDQLHRMLQGGVGKAVRAPSFPFCLKTWIHVFLGLQLK